MPSRSGPAPARPADARVPSPAPGLAVSPHGHPFWVAAAEPIPWPDPAAAVRVETAFAQGVVDGLIHLGSRELHTALPAGMSWWRELTRLCLDGLCHGVSPEADTVAPPAAPPVAALALLLERLPPMPGGEYVGIDALAQLWTDLDRGLRTRARAWQGGPTQYLAALDPAWRLVGRVCFHLAENRRHPDYPFAFLATYAASLSPQGRVQYQPLAAALQHYAGQADHPALLRLLAPVRAAAAASDLARELLASRSLFRPLAWTADQAYRFLQEAPRLDQAGVIVRLPDLWANGRPPRPQVQVRVGQAQAQGLGLTALLDFSLEAALDGEPLTDDEWHSLLAASSGLVLLRGRWVEADPERLRAAMGYWQKAARLAGDGLPFGEALRMLAGVGGRSLGEEVDSAVGSTDLWGGLQAGAWLATTLARLRDPAQLAALGAIAGLEAQLRPYQQTGVAWLRFMGQLGLGACLADDMGLGKTLQVLALLLARQAAGQACGPSLLVAPASLLGNWRAEMERFAPRLRGWVAHPSELSPDAWRSAQQDWAGAVANHDLVLTTYGLVTRMAALRQLPWDLVILDEAQAIKNPAARQTRAVKELPARQRLALTGTPVENRLGDLWSIFDFLNPGLLGSARTFARFVQARGADGSALGRLRNLTRPYILRRMKTDRGVIADLPDKTEVKVWCGLAPAQAALYEQAIDELAGVVADATGIQRRGVVLACLTRLKQICNHPSHWLRDGRYREADSGKFGRLRLLAEELVERQEKALVFTQYQEITAPLQAFLAGLFGTAGLVLQGSTPVAERRRLVEAFQHEQGPPFMVLTTKAGGVGLNLTEASHVIHFDRWWNPAVENQATDRAFRIGQRRPVLVHKFACRGTVEERIDALLASKSNLAEEVLGRDPGERLLTEMEDQELLRFVALDLTRAGSEE